MHASCLPEGVPNLQPPTAPRGQTGLPVSTSPRSHGRRALGALELTAIWEEICRATDGRGNANQEATVSSPAAQVIQSFLSICLS